MGRSVVLGGTGMLLAMAAHLHGGGTLPAPVALAVLVALAARAVVSGDADIVIAGGVESMSRAPFVIPKAGAAYDRGAQIYDTTIGWRFPNPVMVERFGVDPMPRTAQTVADEYGVSREDQDAFALRSQQRVARSRERLAREIVPVEVALGRGRTASVDADEHPRETSPEALARLAPIFPGGSVTAGNSSGVNDGAAALLVVSEAVVGELGLTPLARVVGAASAGVEPRVMGVGPVPAVQRLLGRRGVALSDVGVVELNEAFAAQALAVLRGLGLPDVGGADVVELDRDAATVSPGPRGSAPTALGVIQDRMYVATGSGGLWRTTLAHGCGADPAH